MILTNGKRVIGDALANALGTHISVGIGSTLPTVADEFLEFEVWRGPIIARAFNPTTNTIHYKTTLPAELEATILEVGLVSADSNEAHSTIITSASPDNESWTGGTWSGTGVRMGPSGLNVAAATATLNGLAANLSQFTTKDYIQMAYHAPVGGGTVTVRLYTDATNYVSTTFNVVAGYNIAERRIEDFTSTGTPDLANISDLSIVHAGAGSVTLDVMRAVKKDVDAIAIKRSVISPAVKVLGISMDVEESIKI